MTLLQTIAKDKLLWTGWSLLLLSAIVFCIPLYMDVSPDQYTSYFAFHFGLVVLCHFILYFNKGVQFAEHKMHYRLIKLLMLLISAYALNREMEVFAASPTWFAILLVLLSANYLGGVVFALMPRWLQHLSFFVYGAGLVVFAYLSIYLLPLYIVSIPGLLLLGISLHTFVPLLLFFFTTFQTARLAESNPRFWISFAAGILVPIVIVVAFAISWDNKVIAINRQYNSAIVEGDDKLPLWIQVGQVAGRDGMTEKILKTDLVYKIPSWGEGFFWSMPQRSFGDQQQVHDPLVLLANLFSQKIHLSEEEKIKILESQYNARHEALERLWSGDQLKTEQVSTNVKVWPQMRFAYTEKTLTVFNHESKRAWQNQAEGIYTFHMPEGAVVTSLSLWINGREEKGILTSKQNATTAYRTIVGYERRDPSVVHWQEGNTVSVRVFPIMAESSRTFKIGITAPLRKEGRNLIYDNIWFDGPDAASAYEMVKLEVVKEGQHLVQQALLPSDKKRVVTREGDYQPRWSTSFEEAPLAATPFSFDGYQYSIQSYQLQRVATTITDIYLDINEAWSSEDLKQVWTLARDKRVWVYSGGMQRVDEGNREELFSELKKLNYSLFPFHLVADREHSLVISQSGSYSPTLSDLENSAFLNNLEKRLNAGDRIKLFYMGTDMSPFIRSLKERRYFDFEAGGPELLVRLLANNQFVQDIETDSEVILHNAEVTIKRQPGESASSAPDHLMRLFAYNHILQQLGRNKGATPADSTALIREAEQAYVVSPVSSLVVLETQNDYDRFGIKDSENSLKNASLKNNGAVPEPGEWAIIILVGGAFLFFVCKNRFF